MGACYVRSRRALSQHQHGRVDADELAAQLDAIELHLQAARQQHAAADLLVELLGHSALLTRPVVALLAVVLAMSCIAFAR